VLINHRSLVEEYSQSRGAKQSRHSVSDRLAPSVFQYDYLVLKTLGRDIQSLVDRLPAMSTAPLALDLGAEKSPYAALLRQEGFEVRRLDLTVDSNPDYVGTVEDTGLENDRFDLILCTQVLEHCTNPWTAIRELSRILKPGGFAIVSVPHVWFYHPHPADNWRFTQEGVLRLCQAGRMTLIELRSQGGTVLTLFQVVCFSLYGIIGKWGALIYAVLNVIAEPLDRLLPNTLFCQNFAWLAQKTVGLLK
jgi:SAM-dependent methyltransferase